MFGYNRLGYSQPAVRTQSVQQPAPLSSSPIQQTFSESLATEIERLLLPPPAISPPQITPQYLQWNLPSPARTRHSSSSDSGIDVSDGIDLALQLEAAERERADLPFHANGVECEVDELDEKLIRNRTSPPRMLTSSLPPYRVSAPIPIPGVDQPMSLEELQRMYMTRGRGNKKDLTCVFCKNNNEAVFIYTSHNLKDDTGRVLCPILREYQCPNCHAKGDNAHTLKYCPLSSDLLGIGGLALGIGSLRTARTSTGRRRTRAGDLAARLGRRPPPSQLLPADKFQKVIGPLL